MDDQLTSLIDEKENIEEINRLSSSILRTDISDEMQKAYLDYAMSVIVSRALPDVRDGLKPVQRRIIYAMQDQGMTASSKFHKCAAVVGEVLKKYHPHGDTSVYEALVRMGQDFSLRYPLIFPQGNFGSIDGDPPAAMRYTECKLHKVSEELYTDIDKNTVDFAMNDLQNYEPMYLPSLLPNILLNGASGIAVGMATNIPPHNLSEVIDGISLLIERQDLISAKGNEKDKSNIITQEVLVFDGKLDSIKVDVAQIDFSSAATVEDLVKVIKGPDFPTGGIIFDKNEIVQMYATGKGGIVTEAKMNIEEVKGGRVKIIVSEIPYQVNKATLIAKIADLVKIKKIDGISDLRDESNKKGMRIVIELKKDAIPKKVENQLLKYTPLRSTFNANMVALIDNEPKLMPLKMILSEFIKHRQKVVVRRTLFLLGRAKEREHILLGLKKAIDNIDAVIALIRASKDADTAKKGLIAKFDLTEIQAQAILDMQLRKLAALERQKIEDELNEIVNTIKDYEALLISPEAIIKRVQEEISYLKEKYGDERKTQVVKGKAGELAEEDLIVNENCIVTISKSGYIKRLKDDTYTKQSRGGKGKIGVTLKEEDQIDTIKFCNTHDWALFFTNSGKVYKLRIWEIPESSRQAKGTPIVNFLNITQKEKIQAVFTLTNEELDEGKGYVFFVTEEGRAKKTGLSDFANIRSSGIIAIKLTGEDCLSWADLISNGDEILITTAFGQSIKFKESDVRTMGRTAGGVGGVRLTKKDDFVVGTVSLSKDSGDKNLLVIAQNGYGKKTKVSEYKTQNRGGSGILTYKVTDKTGRLVSARVLEKKDDVLIATESGKIIRLSEKDIPLLGRATQGVRLIKLDDKDKVVSVTLIEEEKEEN